MNLERLGTLEQGWNLELGTWTKLGTGAEQGQLLELGTGTKTDN